MSAQISDLPYRPSVDSIIFHPITVIALQVQESGTRAIFGHAPRLTRLSGYWRLTPSQVYGWNFAAFVMKQENRSQRDLEEGSRCRIVRSIRIRYVSKTQLSAIWLLLDDREKDDVSERQRRLSMVGAANLLRVVRRSRGSNWCGACTSAIWLVGIVAACGRNSRQEWVGYG
ncbi:hypothetical protein PM082_021787 [Marasmius tenuissimus]|nr:hypothetical protein PM082_021787 [Marasmius tenuissimus]